MQQHRRTFMTYQNRSAEIQNFFRHIEDKYGNLSHLIDKGKAAETIVAEDGILHPQHLTRLFQHDATALHVKGFYHKESALKLGEELIKESIHHSNNWKVSTSRGLESSDVATLGKHSPYNVAVARDQHSNNSGNGKEEYFDGVQQEFISRRKSSTYNKDDKANYYQLWPLDKLRLELEESWSSGAGLAREETKQQHGHGYTRPFGGGLPRIMRGPTRWKRGFIHVDELGPLDTNRGLFSVNIYLNMPPKNKSDDKKDGKDNSGGLYVWPLGVRSRLDWYRVSLLLYLCVWITSFEVSLHLNTLSIHI